MPAATITVGLAITLACAAAIPALLQPNPAAPLKTVPFLLLLGAVAAALLLERAVRGLEFFSILTFASVVYALIFAVVPLADEAFHNPAVSDPSWMKAAWFGLAGYVCFAGGYFALHEMVSPRALQQRRHWNCDRAMRLALFGVLISIAAALEVLGGPGGVVRLIQSFALRRTFVHSSSLVTVGESVATAAIALAAATWAWRPSRRHAVIAFCVVLPLAIAACSWTGSRWRDLSIMVALTAIIHLGRRRLPRSVIAVLVVAGVAAFIYAGQERNVVGTNAQTPNLTGTNFYYHYVGGQHDVNQFHEFVNTLDGVPQRLPYQWGKTFLTVIPRSLRPGTYKTGGQVYDQTFYPTLFASGTSIPNTLPGELYVNFALPGILVGMALYGVLLAWLDGIRRNWRATPAGLAIHAYSLLPVALVIRGDFTTFIGYWAVGLIPFWIAIRWVMAPERSERAT